MEKDEQNSDEIRLCKICHLSLSEDDHGNRKAHRECAYNEKKQRQKKKYRVGNSAKLLIQKNETIAEQLYYLDEQKQGISFLTAMEYGLKFECPTSKRNHFDKTINMFDQYGYALETTENEILIFIYHATDLK